MGSFDNWFWCPWCGVTEWFKNLGGNKYECTHCHNVLDFEEYKEKAKGK